METNLTLDFLENKLINSLVNKIMKNGEKRRAWKIVFKASKIVEEKTSSPFKEILEKAIENLMPKVEMKKRKAGAGSYKIPQNITSERAKKIAFRWLVQTLRERPKRSTQVETIAKFKKWKRKPSPPMFEKLASELIELTNKTGKTYGKLSELIKSAEAGKVFMR